MDNFPIILGLCRAAMQGGNPAVRSHVERLVRSLEKEGSGDQLEAVKKLLTSAEALSEIVPSRVVLSRSAIRGELLTPSVQPPVDRETASPLAEIVHPNGAVANKPVFNGALELALSHLIGEWLHADQLKAANLAPALTTMLYGAPGTGKTMLARYIAHQLEMPLVVARLDGLISSFLGTTARNISALFAFANRYKCVLLLDEFDAVAKLRDDPHELGEIKRVVNTLLQCIDTRALFGFTIAITNHEALLDPAVWRRFDVRIEVPSPNPTVRAEILKRLLPPATFSPEQHQFLTWLTEGYTGSDIKKLSEFLLRQQAISKQEFNFMQSVRTQVQLSAHSDESSNRRASILGDEALARQLSKDEVARFNQEQLKTLFGCSQSTISRWLKKQPR
jgi:hypothetical protein